MGLNMGVDAPGGINDSSSDPASLEADEAEDVADEVDDVDRALNMPAPVVVVGGTYTYEGGSHGVVTSRAFSSARRNLPSEECIAVGLRSSSAMRCIVNGALCVSMGTFKNSKTQHPDSHVHILQNSIHALDLPPPLFLVQPARELFPANEDIFVPLVFP